MQPRALYSRIFALRIHHANGRWAIESLKKPFAQATLDPSEQISRQVAEMKRPPSAVESPAVESLT